MLGTADEDTGQEYQKSANGDLKSCLKEGRIHVFPANPRNDPKFDKYNNGSKDRGGFEIRNEVGQGMTKTTKGRHDACGKAADHGVTSAGELAIIGKTLGQPHGNARTNGSSRANKKRLPRIASSEGSGKQRRQS